MILLFCMYVLQDAAYRSQKAEMIQGKAKTKCRDYEKVQRKKNMNTI